MAKFKCSHCDYSLDLLNYSLKVKDGKIVHFDTNTKEELTCPLCKVPLDMIYPKTDSLEGPSFQKFGSMSPLEKQNFLKKRSAEDNKKSKYVENYKEKERYNG